MRIILDFLRADANLHPNKRLSRIFGLNAAVIFSELLKKSAYWEEQGKSDEEGYFYCTIQDLEKETTIGAKGQLAAVRKLEKYGLIMTRIKGIPATRYFKINPDSSVLLRLLDPDLPPGGDAQFRPMDETGLVDRTKLVSSAGRSKSRHADEELYINNIYGGGGTTPILHKKGMEERKEPPSFSKTFSTLFGRKIRPGEIKKLREAAAGLP
ncbi:MAG: hypothetical protein PHU78_06905, partial [Heliobacteriaceae bacterium]|nr:hypothetical protein [Heliobacteriaceae bacterium]